MKHTPGPWVAHVSMVDEETHNDVMLIRSEHPLRGIASFEVESEEDEANARLIAAAPELLSALKLVLERYWLEPKPHMPEEIFAVRVAIEKAEGSKKRGGSHD